MANKSTATTEESTPAEGDAVAALTPFQMAEALLTKTYELAMIAADEHFAKGKDGRDAFTSLMDTFGKQAQVCSNLRGE